MPKIATLDDYKVTTAHGKLLYNIGKKNKGEKKSQVKYGIRVVINIKILKYNLLNLLTITNFCLQKVML